MKFRARFSQDGTERSRDVEVANGSGTAELLVDGTSSALNVVSRSGGRWSLVAPDGRHVEASVEHRGDGQTRVVIGGAAYEFELLDELNARSLAAAGKGRARHTGELKAAIPGRVLRLLVEEGHEVAAGQPVLVLEAMKMENEVKAPRSGRIRSIAVSAGQAVAAGEVLIRFADE